MAARVEALRHLVRRHRRLAALVLAVTLALRVLVPAGFMPVAAGGTITIQLCSGAATGPQTMEMVMPGMPAMPHHDAAKADAPCAFAGLALPWLGSLDPLLFTAALAFILALGFVALAPRTLHAPNRLRPPLRGPPLPA